MGIYACGQSQKKYPSSRLRPARSEADRRHVSPCALLQVSLFQYWVHGPEQVSGHEFTRAVQSFYKTGL